MSKNSSSLEVTEALTQKVAKLARLELTPQEITTFTNQLKNILEYVGSLQSVDVSGVQPLTHPVASTTFMREDVIVESPKDSEGKPKVMQCAPDALYDGYKVPQII